MLERSESRGEMESFNRVAFRRKPRSLDATQRREAGEGLFLKFLNVGYNPKATLRDSFLNYYFYYLFCATYLDHFYPTS